VAELTFEGPAVGALPDRLAFEAIGKIYPGVVALDQVGFAVPAAHVHGLMGENGAGKSTLIKILGGDIRSSAGTVRIEGVAVEFKSTRDAFAAGVAVVHQELQLVPELTVAENLTLGRFPQRLGVVVRHEMFAVVDGKLRQAGIELDPRARVGALSIGTRQMVEIAKAIMVDARVIALDEPTSSLSTTESEVLFRLIARLRGDGRTVLYVSHRLDEILRICDGCTVLRDGRLAAHHATMQGLTRDTLVSQMVGREISDIWGYTPRPAQPTGLAVRGIAGAWIKAPISFTARRGEIVGFFGLVGAGRSELMRLVCGADPASAGEVAIDGGTVDIASPRSAIRAGLVLCPEDRKADGIIQGVSVEENIVISCRRLFSPFGVIDRGRSASVADDFIGRLRIRTPSRRQAIQNLSGGNQQKTILARWLAESGVRVLVVDEPTRGIDVGARAEIYAVLYELARGGMAIVVVSSDLPEVMGITDRLLVMRHGAISTAFDRAAYDEGAILRAALPDGASRGLATEAA